MPNLELQERFNPPPTKEANKDKALEELFGKDKITLKDSFWNLNKNITHLNWQNYTYFELSKFFDEEIENNLNNKLKNLSKIQIGNKLKNLLPYFKTATFGAIAIGSLITFLSFLPNYSNSNKAFLLVMSQNVENKVKNFQHALIKGDVVNERAGIIYYKSKGEKIKDIAAKFHLKESTIRIANKIPENIDYIKPGKQIMILPVDGVLHPVKAGESIEEIAKRYKVPLNKITSINNIDNPHLIKVHQPLLIPGASTIKLRKSSKNLSRLARLVKSKSTFKVGYISSRTTVNRYLDFGRSCWPTNGIITSIYGWRWGSFHRGIDIAADYGTPVRSIRSGVVIGAGWEGGYGNMITIDHGGGLVTRYAHCASILVSYGQRVYAGQVIGTVGSTGFSTGPHVHFEVLVNGSNVNPRPYF